MMYISVPVPFIIYLIQGTSIPCSRYGSSKEMAQLSYSASFTYELSSGLEKCAYKTIHIQWIPMTILEGLVTRVFGILLYAVPLRLLNDKALGKLRTEVRWMVNRSCPHFIVQHPIPRPQFPSP